jgi:SagB-type dehydrogenase family enzyme
MTEQGWRAYHEATRHTAERLRQSTHTLDWANMPNPFRHYESAPLVDLPADPEAPQVSAWDVLRGRLGPRVAMDGPDFFSRLFFYSASISATKRAPSGARYSLRVNPSSGNLHPTEFHFAARGVAGWEDGIYHYRPSQHMVERRGRGGFGFQAQVEFVLTSIAWREAWKYQDRAYRYCLLDMGHAWQSLELAARAMGWPCEALGLFDHAALADRLRLAGDEWPLLVARIGDEGAPSVAVPEWSAGTPNALSDFPRLPESIAAVHAATIASKRTNWTMATPPADGDPVGGLPIGEAVRRRRSALDFIGGTRTMSLPQLLALLSVARAQLLELYLYVHRVDGLPPGLYRAGEHLECIRSGDQRVVAAGLSLGQNLAGNACVALSMLADLEQAEDRYGPRGYRYAHMEAGALGQRLYVGAEALGLRATGIGAFFDDRVHEYLGVERKRVVYHFAIGYPVADPRLED